MGVEQEKLNILFAIATHTHTGATRLSRMGTGAGKLI